MRPPSITSAVPVTNAASSEDKDGFLVFELCQSVEFFDRDFAPAGGKLPPSFVQRLLTRHADLILSLDHRNPPQASPADEEPDGTQTDVGLRWDVARRLHQEITG